MADGAVTLTLTLDADTAARLDVVAREAGIGREDLILELIEDAAAFDDERRQATQAALAAYDETGLAHPLEDVLAEVRADLEVRLSALA
jgi:predicted transcriptional regulator